jgi:hypothetical protein
MAGGAGVDDRQTPVSEANRASMFVNWSRCPDAFVVSAPMLDALEHGSDLDVRLNADDSSYSTHSFEDTTERIKAEKETW